MHACQLLFKMLKLRVAGTGMKFIISSSVCIMLINNYVCSMGIWVSVMSGGGGQKRGVPARKLVRHFLGNYEYCFIP